MKRILSLMAVLLSTFIFAQTNVSGTVVDEDNNPIPGANIVFDSTTGAVANFDGEFSITVKQNPPFELQVSSIGFETATVQVGPNNLVLAITLSESENLLDDVVISASRVPQRLFESPVTIEKFDYKDIAQSTGADFYSSLEGLKGVQINSGGLLLQTVSTRGFSTVYNEGFVQLVDGMDNEAPGLSFSAGNLVGMNQLDIFGVELIPGAASALYGANAFKGILLMTSKNPFDFQGTSAYFTNGVTSQDVSGDNHYYDLGVRFAKAFSDKFAVKTTISYVEGLDWGADDRSDRNKPQGTFVPGTSDPADPSTFPDYVGVNVYGSQGVNLNMTSTFLGAVIPGLVGLGQLSASQGATISAIVGNFAPNYFGSQLLQTTGYAESDLTDGIASSFKVDVAAHYRFNGNSELIFNTKIGTGNTILHATNRNMLKNFMLQQHKIEYKTRNLNLRAYTSIEDAGNTHDLSALGGRIANAQPGGIQAGWAGAYLQNYFLNLFGQINPNPIAALNSVLGGILFGGDTSMFDRYVTPKMNYMAHAFARGEADKNMLVPGSDAFKQAYLTHTTTPIAKGGAAIEDNSMSNNFEVNYNASDLVNGFELQLGAQARQYVLRSGGSLFTDYDDPIKFSQLGVYTQVQKDLFDGVVKLTGSMRYDKSQYFDGQFTPRIGGLIFLSPTQNLRFSYQTGFQNPSSQDQYIGLDVGQAVLMGSSPDSIDRFRMTFTGSNFNQYTITGPMVMSNSLLANEFLAGSFVPGNLDPVEPQHVMSREFGYRFNGKKVSLDVSAYWSDFSNFIASKNVIVPMYGSLANGSALAALAAGDFKIFSVDNNTNEKVSTMGVTVGLDTKIIDKFDFGASFSYNEMDRSNIDPNFETGFNTPKVRTKFSLGSTELADNFAFNVSARYHNAFLWESSFLNGVIPAMWTFDAAMNFDVPEINSKVKVGAVNFTGKDYMMMPGSGMIGSQYYVTFTLNP
jgi:outer membrane receptor protein involved in Fe transport